MNYNGKYMTLKNTPNKEVKFIYHLSDIHIKDNTTYIDEYVSVFENLYQTLRENGAQRDTSLIVIAGDLVDSADYTVDTQKLLIPFLENLSEFSDIVIIPGNHDIKVINDTTEERLGIILQYFDNVYYLPATGRYIYNNIVFYHSSVLDKHLLRADDDDIDIPNKVKIALYHGTVSSEYVELNYKNMVDIRNFNNYDLCMYGDTHKFEFMNLKKTAAYCSSLLRTNRGQDNEQHGLIKWDIPNRKGEFIEIKNDYGHISYTFLDYNIVQYPVNTYMPKFPVVVIRYNNINPQICEEEIKKLVPNYRHIIYKQYVPEINDKDNKIIMKDVTTDDLHIVEYQNELIKQYYNYYVNNGNNEQLNKIQQLNTEMNNQLDTNYIDEISTRETNKYDIQILKFSNLFSYGAGIMIDFTDKTNSYNVQGDNYVGKTNLLNIILYSVFGQCLKAKLNMQLLNHEKEKGTSIVTIKVNNRDTYRINRSILKVYNDNKHEYKIESTVTLFRLAENGVFKDVSGNGINETNKKITALFGDYKNIIKTNFMLSPSDGIIKVHHAERFQYFTNITKISIFEKLIAKANEDLKKLELIDKNLSEVLRINDKDNLERELINNNNMEKGHVSKIEEYTKQIQICHDNIDKLYSELSKIKPYDSEYFKKLESKKQDNLSKIVLIDKSIQENITKQNINNNEITKLEHIIETMYINSTQSFKINKDKMAIELCERINSNTKIRTEILSSVMKTINKKESHKSMIEYNLLTNIINSDIEKLKNIKENVLDYTKIEEYKQIITLLKHDNIHIQDQINALICELSVYNYEINRIDKKNSKYDVNILEKQRRYIENKLINNKRDLYMYSEKLWKLKSSLDRIVSNIEIIKNNINEHNKCADELKNVKEEIKLYTLYKNLISRNGLQSLLLDNILMEIERHANNFLEKITDFQIKINKDITCYENNGVPKIEISRIKRGFDLKSCQYSNYEEMIINMAIRVAMMDTNSYTVPNLFVMDEVFNYMDKQNIKKTDDIIKTINSKVKFSLVISHLDIINSQFINKIKIIESNDSNVPVSVIEGRSEEQRKEVVSLIDKEENEPKATKYQKKEPYKETDNVLPDIIEKPNIIIQEIEKVSISSAEYNSFHEINKLEEPINKITVKKTVVKESKNRKKNNNKKPPAKRGRKPPLRVVT